MAREIQTYLDPVFDEKYRPTIISVANYEMTNTVQILYWTARSFPSSIANNYTGVWKVKWKK